MQSAIIYICLEMQDIMYSTVYKYLQNLMQI